MRYSPCTPLFFSRHHTYRREKKGNGTLQRNNAWAMWNIHTKKGRTGTHKTHILTYTTEKKRIGNLKCVYYTFFFRSCVCFFLIRSHQKWWLQNGKMKWIARDASNGGCIEWRWINSLETCTHTPWMYSISDFISVSFSLSHFYKTKPKMYEKRKKIYYEIGNPSTMRPCVCVCVMLRSRHCFAPEQLHLFEIDAFFMCA